jgi:hypothetical protein
MDEAPIADDTEARRLAGLLLTGEARIGRLRQRLKQYLESRDPLAFDDLELGFFPTTGRYDAREVARVVADAGGDPWPLLSVDSRALRVLFKRQPILEAALASVHTPTPPWFGHRKSKSEGATGTRDHSSGGSGTAPGRPSCPGHEPRIP